jgi:hypothetical protein
MDYWAEPGICHDPETHAPAHATARPSQAARPRSASRPRAPDERVPLVSERNRGGRKATAVTHRRWQLLRYQGHRHVRLSLVHLGVPQIEAKAAAMEDGGGHGGSRPRFGRLRRTRQRRDPIGRSHEHQWLKADSKH